jgi:co-chaperonin GroES (HSP10)
MSDKTQTVDLSPLQNNLLLEPVPATDKIGMIIIPEAHQRPLNQGVVADKGPLATSAIEIGDIVFFGLHSESRLDYGGKKYIIVAEEACLGRIRKTKATPTPDGHDPKHPLTTGDGPVTD